MRLYLIMICAYLLMACQGPEISKAPTEYIGTATMRKDGVIVMELLARTDEPEDVAAIGHALLYISPDDRRYNEILNHLGGLKVGEEKLVPAWPKRKK